MLIKKKKGPICSKFTSYIIFLNILSSNFRFTKTYIDKTVYTINSDIYSIWKCMFNPVVCPFPFTGWQQIPNASDGYPSQNLKIKPSAWTEAPRGELEKKQEANTNKFALACKKKTEFSIHNLSFLLSFNFLPFLSGPAASSHELLSTTHVTVVFLVPGAFDRTKNSSRHRGTAHSVFSFQLFS